MEQCISSIYEAALNPEAWEAALPQIVRSFREPTGATVIHAPHACFAGGDIWMYRADPGTYRRAPPELLTPDRNPGLQAALTAQGAMVDRQSLLPDRDMEFHSESRQFFLHNGIEHMLIGAPQLDAEVGSLFVLSRCSGQASFDPEEKRLATALAAHVGRAMRMFRSLRLAEFRQQAFGAALERLAHGVLLADRDLQILHANAAGETLLAGGCGIARFRGRLALYDRRAQQVLEAAGRRLAGAPTVAGDARLSAVRPGGRPPLRITVYPALGNAPASLAPKGRILVFVTDPAREMPASERLRLVFELTPAEARVAAHAAAAVPVAAIASRLGLSPNTVKTHLKTIYLKAGVQNRSDLVRLALAEH